MGISLLRQVDQKRLDTDRQDLDTDRQDRAYTNSIERGIDV